MISLLEFESNVSARNHKLILIFNKIIQVMQPASPRDHARCIAHARNTAPGKNYMLLRFSMSWSDETRTSLHNYTLLIIFFVIYSNSLIFYDVQSQKWYT